MKVRVTAFNQEYVKIERDSIRFSLCVNESCVNSQLRQWKIPLQLRFDDATGFAGGEGGGDLVIPARGGATMRRGSRDVVVVWCHAP